MQIPDVPDRKFICLTTGEGGSDWQDIRDIISDAPHKYGIFQIKHIPKVFKDHCVFHLIELNDFVYSEIFISPQDAYKLIHLDSDLPIFDAGLTYRDVSFVQYISEEELKMLKTGNII